MGRIQSNVGLITGVPIEETVAKLLKVAAQPRDLLVTRTKSLQEQQVAINSLTALTIAIQLAARNLGKTQLFEDRVVTSSQPDILSAEKNGTPLPGVYQFTPVRKAQSHQLLSGSFAEDQAVGQGTLSIRFGGFVDTGMLVSELNGDAGFARGQIKIIDRSGTSEVIDLRYVHTIEDVLDAINAATSINVHATAEGDSIRLTDRTGQTISNLKVQEVGSGTTAASLGLQGIDAASDSVLGQDIVQLGDSTRLAGLNDGNGVHLRAGVADLEIHFSDGSTPLQVDLDVSDNATVGEVLDALNSADPARLSAQIVGDHIELTDLTSGSNAFTVQSIFGSDAAEGLGLNVAAQSGIISGRRLLGGLKTTLLSTLGGGQGVGALGQIQIQDRSGATATIDLSAAESLDDVLSAINSAGNGVIAQVNHSRDGIELIDTTGQTGQFIVSSLDATQTAESLGIAVNAAVAKVDSGSLDRQVINAQTLLSTYNFGEAVGNGSFTIKDTEGKVGAVNLTLLGAKTIGDVLDAINGLGLGLEARVNDAGDGIALVDTAGGSGTIEVTDSGTGQAATNLGIAGQSTLVDVNGVPTQVLSGSTTITVSVDADDTLRDVADKIFELGVPISATVFREGNSGNVRLSIVSNVSGRAGALLVDDRDFGTTFTETTAAQDALLVLGGSNVLVASSSNTFESIVDGLNVTVNGTSTTPIEVRVENSPNGVVTNVKLLVDKYNELVSKLKEFTKFDPDTNTTGILFGTAEALRVETSLGRLVTDRFSGVGEIRNLAQLGITVKDDGELEFDEAKLKRLYESDPDQVEEFFTKADVGFSAKLDKLIERLAGVGDTLLVGRSDTLQRRIDFNNERIAKMNDKLERERDRLFKYFFKLENTIARLQNNLSAIANIQAIAPLKA